VQRLEAPALRHEAAREPVEQLRVRGQAAELAEVVGGGREAAAEVGLPPEVADLARGEAEAKEREVAETRATLEKEKANAPALFGKDAHARRVQELEEDLDEARKVLAERKAAHAQALAESASVQARAQTEQGEITVVERAMHEAREREQSLRKDIADAEAQLGPALPASRVASTQAEEYLGQINARRNELRGRLTDLAARGII